MMTLNYIRPGCFCHNVNVQEKFFSRVQTEKGIAWHIDASVVWTLIDDGKLANQIARLVAIVVKSKTPKFIFEMFCYHSHKYISFFSKTFK